MDLDWQLWESLLAELNSCDAKCDELDKQAKAFSDPPIASGESDMIFPEDFMMETLPNLQPNDSDWYNFADYFGLIESNPRFQPDFTLGGNMATGSAPATLGTIPHFQEPRSTLPTYLSSATSSSHSSPQPSPDNTTFLYSDQVASSPLDAMACSPCVSHSSSDIESRRGNRADSTCLQGVSDLRSPPGCSSPTSNNATTTTAGLPTSNFGAGWEHFDQVSDPPSLDDWNLLWQQFTWVEQPNATSEETKTTTALPRKRRSRNQTTSTASSSSLDVPAASADPLLPQVDFDCFTGSMVVPPGREPHPDAHLAILHVHRLRKPSSPWSANPEVPPGIRSFRYTLRRPRLEPQLSKVEATALAILE
ncbi:hypothetical protein H1R20_g1456, partial [Candolleomyces eurysporus]